MADANARLERLRCRNAAQGHTEPIIHRQRASAEVEEKEDLKSSYLPSGRMEPSLSFTATATSCALSGSQLTPMQALAMAQELLRYQPTEGGREGWLARIVEIVPIANKDPALGNAQGAGVPDPAVGPCVQALGTTKRLQQRGRLPMRHLYRAGSQAAKSSDAL
jgi:hypothetical protein